MYTISITNVFINYIKKKKMYNKNDCIVQFFLLHTVYKLYKWVVCVYAML